MHFWYDERNLPIQIGDNEYRYTADGQRYYKKVGTVEEYYIMDDNLTAGVFSNTGTGYELDYWNILGHGVEGRYVPGSGYRYYYKDHLGSTRAVVNATGTILDATDYYPFGLAMPGRSHTTAPGTKEMFTGHERDHEVGLDYMVARRYDPALGRFMSVDPLFEVYPNWTSYHYVLNNPVANIDPTGEYVVRGTTVTRVGRNTARAFNIASFSVVGGASAMVNRSIHGDPSFQNSKFDRASLGMGGALKVGGRLISGLKNVSTSDRIIARMAVEGVPSAFLDGISGLVNSFGDALVGDQETFTNIVVDEAIFSAAIGLEAPDGTQLGSLDRSGTEFSASESAIETFGESGVEAILNERFDSLNEAARKFISLPGFDITNKRHQAALEEHLERQVRFLNARSAKDE